LQDGIDRYFPISGHGECTEIDQETENHAVIGHLKTAVVALEAFDGGDAASSIKAAMR
jgi:hypothetical protein